MRTRTANPTRPAIELPPPFRLVTLREVGDAFAHARANAAQEGAGTIIHVGRFDLAEFAVVLEPDEPLRLARRTFYAGMVALYDALIALAPPEIKIDFGWPDAISVNLGLVGGGRMAWPKDAKEDEPPAWLVFGATIRLVSMADGLSGLQAIDAALADEGFEDAAADRLVEAFSRHLMVALDTWQERGFSGVAREYLKNLKPDGEKGIRRDIDENGDLLVRRMGNNEAERRKLVDALARASWLDPKTGGPRA
jgi:biotin-(acetyl-CoA carboxylase) ligase